MKGRSRDYELSKIIWASVGPIYRAQRRSYSLLAGSLVSDAPIPSKGMGFQAKPHVSVTSPQGGPAGLVAETLRTPGQHWCKRVAPSNGPRPGGLRRSTGRQLFSPPPVPQGAGPSIRERSRIANP